MVPQVFDDVLTIGNDGGVGADTSENVPNFAAFDAAARERQEGLVQLQVAHALGVQFRMAA